MIRKDTLTRWLENEIQMAKNEIQHFPITQPLNFDKEKFMMKWKTKIDCYEKVITFVKTGK